MQLHNMQQFSTLLEQTTDYIRTFYRDHLHHREGEKSYLDLDLSFSPVVPNVKPLKRIDASLCTRCDRRISYKVNQFTVEAPVLPLLVLIHNPFFNQKSQFYQDPGLDKIFTRMLQKVFGVSAESFLVRDALRCHFGRQEIGNPSWRDNCIGHIEEDIQKHHLKGILVLGQAAVLLFPEKQDLKERSGKVSSFLGLPTMVSSGPERVQYLIEKGNKEELQSLAAQIETNLGLLKTELGL